MEPLVIPLTIDGDQAIRLLERLKTEGQKSGQEVQKGAEGATKEHENLASVMRRVNIEGAAMGFGRQVLESLSQGAVQASQDLRQMAIEFINLRDRARELAGVLGKPGNIDFTQEQLKFASETGFADAGKAIDYRTAFQGEANQYKGRFKTEEEFSAFEKEAARLGNQNNVPADVMAKIAGMVIRTGAKEGQTSQEAMQRLGGSFKTMMAGSGNIGDLSQQLSRMSGLVGEGNAFKTVEEAAVATRMAAETNLPEAYTWQTEMRTGVIELSTDDKKAEKAKELGITPDTTNFEAIKSLSAAQERSGKNMDVFLSEIFPQKRIRDAYRDAIKAYRNNVMTQGLKDASAVLPGQIEGETSAFFADPTQGGFGSVQKAKTAEAEGEFAKDAVLAEPFLERARGKTVAQRKSPLGKALTGLGETFPFNLIKGGYSGTSALEHWTAYEDVRTEAGEAGVDLSGISRPNPITSSERTLEHAIVELVKLTKEANMQRDRTNQRPLAATGQPPNPASRQVAVGGW
jgi:hypothetical protein